MRWTLTLALCSAGIVLAQAEWPFPSSDGTTWEYTLRKELEQTTKPLTRQVVPGTETDSVEIDTLIDGELRSSQRLKDDGGRIVSAVESTTDDGLVQPAATILPETFDRGKMWDFRGQIADTDVGLPLMIVGKERIEVPAGRFEAWHIHGERQSGFFTRADEWFVPGLGWIKETVTQRAPSGDLLTRNTLELVKAPDNATTHESLEVSISTSTAGEPLRTISPDALQIVARWRVSDVLPHTKLRAVWIAENVTDIAPPDYQVDEATAVADGPEAVGSFTLERPPQGWTPGSYRVDFYVGNRLAQTVKLTIASGPNGKL